MHIADGGTFTKAHGKDYFEIPTNYSLVSERVNVIEDKSTRTHTGPINLLMYTRESFIIPLSNGEWLLIGGDMFKILKMKNNELVSVWSRSSKH